jgi:hypothetical protein
MKELKNGLHLKKMLTTMTEKYGQVQRKYGQKMKTATTFMKQEHTRFG